MRQTKRTKIVCTIGPASREIDTLGRMVKAGMNVARLNFSHGTHEEHARMIGTLRQVAEAEGEPLALLQDLQGPKIRVGSLPSEGVALVAGGEVTLSTDSAPTPPKIAVTYAGLHNDVKPGDRLLLDDGLLELEVVGVAEHDIRCAVVIGGLLTSRKGINLPTATLAIPAVTEKDRADIRFGVEMGVDWVALSFVRGAADIAGLRGLIARFEEETGRGGSEPIRVMAKIEKHEALKNIDEIIDAADGIMVARGDLGIETPAEDVPLAQKRIIEKCLAAAKPVVVATQMLDSMIRNPRPTRAEVSDVANAVIDHADAVMLSGETASGKYPVDAVETMARIIRETEASSYDDLPIDCARIGSGAGSAAAISEMAGLLARGVKAKLVLVATMSGAAARLVSRHRPELPIVAATVGGRTQRQLNLSWGVTAMTLPHMEKVEEFAAAATASLKRQKMIGQGDSIIVVGGRPIGNSGGVNFVEIRQVT